MERKHCDNLEALSEAIDKYGPGVLYRGQVRHFPDDDGLPSLPTSFQRQGCVPDLMIRWTYYAKKALESLVTGWKDSSDTATNQAILQHYGFRSFFLDASGDPRVAAWFAGNEYKSKLKLTMVEDCFEDPIWLRTIDSWFDPAEGDGHLYLISKAALRQRGIQAVHLSEIATKKGTPRYVRQDAYMVGPLIQEGLGSDCILCHISAPAEVMRLFAVDKNVAWLFPEPSEDPVYRELLAMPWEKIRGVPDDLIEAFKRSLELPEYSYHLQKHMPSRSAMYRPFWTRDLPPPPSYQSIDEATKIAYLLCSSALYHGSSSPKVTLPELSRLLQDYDEISIELDGLICHGMGTKYGKGLGVVKIPVGLVCVFEYGVDHPGLRITDIGRFYGLHYRINADDSWERVKHEDDCSCGLDHTENFSLLGRVDLALSDKWLVHVEAGLYVQKGLDAISDPRATWGSPTSSGTTLQVNRLY